jgi:hypothetical protein
MPLFFCLRVMQCCVAVKADGSTLRRRRASMGAVSGGWLIGTDAVTRAEPGRAVAAQFACAEVNFAEGRCTGAAADVAVKADFWPRSGSKSRRN